jgi:hypothetical protein
MWQLNLSLPSKNMSLIPALPWRLLIVFFPWKQSWRQRRGCREFGWECGDPRNQGEEWGELGRRKRPGLLRRPPTVSQNCAPGDYRSQLHPLALVPLSHRFLMSIKFWGFSFQHMNFGGCIQTIVQTLLSLPPPSPPSLLPWDHGTPVILLQDHP